MAKSECELQAALNAAHHYCTLWKLAIKAEKTKAMIFSRGKSRDISKVKKISLMQGTSF